MKGWLQKVQEVLRDPSRRLQLAHYYDTEGSRRLFNFKYFVGGSVLLYSVYFVMIAREQTGSRLTFSMTRRVSRMTGCLTSMPLPPYLRGLLYRAFGSLYGVNFAEILVDDLNSFRTFNQFFTRELKANSRVIDAPEDHSSLVSPCDGKVLSFGEVNTLDSTMDCIKGHTYRLDEFLFGYQSKGDGKQRTTTERLL